MEPVRALIVDDEPLARETIHMLLDDRPEVEVVGVCANGEEAVAAIQEKAPDLVFLDVQMPALDGFGVIQAIGPARMPVVIFVTAYDQYALRAFEAQALDYLLKPFDDERFMQALDRAVQRVRQQAVGAFNTQLAGLMQHLKRPTYLERIMVKTNDAVVFVDTDVLTWIEAAGDYIVLHAGGTKHLLRETMRGILEQLDPRRFVRIHRSSIVRIDAIARLEPFFHGDYVVILHDGTKLKLSRRYWEQVEAVLSGRDSSEDRR